MQTFTPQQIEQAALDARLPITDVLAAAKVSAGSFYRARRGEGEMRPLTAVKLMDAIAQLAERAA